MSLNYNKILNSKIVFVSSVFGKNQKKNRLIPSAIESLILNKPFFSNNPLQKRNFISSEEFASSIYKIIKSPTKYKNKILIKSKFDYKVGEIVSFILHNKNINKNITSKFNYSNIDILYVNEKIKIEAKLKKVIEFYKNE